MRQWITIGCVFLCAISVSANQAQNASEVYAQATGLLKQGDLNAATRQFSTAAKLEPTNAEYREQALLVYRIARMQKRLGQIEDQDNWLKTAVALHQFYLANEVTGLAIDTATAIHAKQDDAASAALLARTQLEANQNAEASAMLSSYTGDSVSPEIHALRGIALARTLQLNAAKQELAGLSLDKTSPAQLACDLARLQALLSEHEAACAALVHCLQKTPPSLREDTLEYVKHCPDFAPLTDSDAFASALSTKSLVKESPCSGGSSCGACPSSRSCGSASKSSCGDKAKTSDSPTQQ